MSGARPPLPGRPHRNLFEIFADWEFIGDELIIDGDTVVERFTAKATHTKEFVGIPGSGRRFQIRGVLLFHVANSLIATEERIYDFSAMLIQLGVLQSQACQLTVERRGWGGGDDQAGRTISRTKNTWSVVARAAATLHVYGFA